MRRISSDVANGSVRVIVSDSDDCHMHKMQALQLASVTCHHGRF